MSGAPVSDALVAFQAEAAACTRCHDEQLLHVEPRAYPLFQRDPTGAARVLVVAEAPNFSDTFEPDKRRLTYDVDTDPTGVFALELLRSVRLRVEDVLFTNAVLCLPAKKGDRYPVGAKQLALCRPWLGRLIDVVVVVAFDTRALAALDGLTSHRLKLKTAVGQLHEWRGRRLLPLYHPGLLGRVTRSAAQQRKDISVLKTFLRGNAEGSP